MNITPEELLSFANLAAAQAKRNYKKQLAEHADRINEAEKIEASDIITLLRVFEYLKNNCHTESHGIMEDVGLAEEVIDRLINASYRYSL